MCIWVVYNVSESSVLCPETTHVRTVLKGSHCILGYCWIFKSKIFVIFGVFDQAKDFFLLIKGMNINYSGDDNVGAVRESIEIDYTTRVMEFVVRSYGNGNIRMIYDYQGKLFSKFLKIMFILGIYWLRIFDHKN